MPPKAIRERLRQASAEEQGDTAANHIAQWPTPIQTVQQCFAVPGVNVYLAKVIVTEILRRELTGDEHAYLGGAEAQRARLSGACLERGRH